MNTTGATARAAVGLPRVVDWLIAAAALGLLAPMLAVAAAAVKAESRGPAVFRQQRVGRGGRVFWLYKLRTMHTDRTGPLVTARTDPRITKVGRFLRRLRFDEVPQLWNVLRGDMALVGPRPEVPRFVEPANATWRTVLSVRPGLTDPTTLALLDEEALLARSAEPETYYREVLLPKKLDGYVNYLIERSWWHDLIVLWHTLLRLFSRRRPTEV